MDPSRRPLFNAACSDDRYRKMMQALEGRVGRVPFRVAETPLFLTHELRDQLVRHALEIVGQLSGPERVAQLRRAVPARYDVPGMDELPNTAQVDFALVQGADGKIDGKLIELQGFPSLYALMPVMGECWAEAMRDVKGLEGPWSTWIGRDHRSAIDVLRRTIVAGEDPEQVVLVDIAPETQKTSPDFTATRQFLGIDPVCITRIKVEGRKLFREKEGRRVRIRRIYNRVVFDELEVKKIQPPFRWNDDLDVSWCSHPNWYWTWSKACLPHIQHHAAPESRILSTLERIPEDLSGFVLKPLFSFAGSGVVIDVTREAIDRVPAEHRDNWVLQRKIEYAPVVKMPDGNGVKAEVRIMLARPPGEKAMTPLLALVRLSRGKMIGVDHNKDMPWTGGSVGMWTA